MVAIVSAFGNIQIAARVAAECYSNVSEFDGPDEYLKALTECLDELAEICGYPLPRFA